MMAHRGGTWRLSISCWLALVAVLAALPAHAQGFPDPLNPQAWQFDLQLENLSGFTGPGSIVRVREFQTEGTGLHFPALGINSQQMPTLDASLWLDELEALHFRFRYFDIGGNHFLSSPIVFNGSTLAPGQNIHTDPAEWLAFGIYYDARLSSLFEPYESGWPQWLRGWEVRGRIGLEFTYINFTIDGGHAQVTATSQGEETKEDFNHQSMPLPTIGLEALHRLDQNFVFDISIQGNWINRWNSLRNEGGTVWASQNGIEVHARLLYSDPQNLGPFQPMLGMFIYTYSQLEDSHEDGNFLRWSSYGPEYGVTVSF